MAAAPTCTVMETEAVTVDEGNPLNFMKKPPGRTPPAHRWQGRSLNGVHGGERAGKLGLGGGSENWGDGGVRRLGLRFQIHT